MIRDIAAALPVELLKLRRSTIFTVTLAASCFVSLMLALMMALVMHPDALPPGILKTKIDLAAISADWPAYLAITGIAQAALGIILYGFAFGWIFGREWDDGTVKDILSLPVSRQAVAVSKLIAAALWCALLGALMSVLSLALGGLLGLPLWSAPLVPGFFRLTAATTALAVLLGTPVAFVAGAGRGTLPAVGFVVLCMALANFFGNIGLGEYFPWTIPLLYSGAIGTAGSRLSAASACVVAFTCISGTAATVLFWKYADQDK
jgi:ABC-2 type transport system permease protein